MSQPTETDLGHIFSNEETFVFFGNRRSSRDALETAYPEFRFIALKQTHSDLVIESPYTGEPPEGDAHFARARGIALCIQTADCMPVMIHDPSLGAIAAIHAGWRGVENEIVLKTLERLKGMGSDLRRANAWIGPHIGASSFEVGQDVGQSLEKRFTAVRAHSPASTSLIEHADLSKVRVNLLAIVRAQLASLGITQDRITEFAIDTFNSRDHESFRRDREKSGRQISFIALRSR